MVEFENGKSLLKERFKVVNEGIWFKCIENFFSKL